MGLKTPNVLWIMMQMPHLQRHLYIPYGCHWNQLSSFFRGVQKQEIFCLAIYASFQRNKYWLCLSIVVHIIVQVTALATKLPKEPDFFWYTHCTALQPPPFPLALALCSLFFL